MTTLPAPVREAHLDIRRRRQRAVALVAVTGLGVGAATSLGQTYLDGALNVLRSVEAKAVNTIAKDHIEVPFWKMSIEFLQADDQVLPGAELSRFEGDDGCTYWNRDFRQRKAHPWQPGRND